MNPKISKNAFHMPLETRIQHHSTSWKTYHLLLWLFDFVCFFEYMSCCWTVFRMLNGSPQHFPWRVAISGRSFLEMLPGFGGPLDAEARHGWHAAGCCGSHMVPFCTWSHGKPWEAMDSQPESYGYPMDIRQDSPVRWQFVRWFIVGIWGLHF